MWATFVSMTLNDFCANTNSKQARVQTSKVSLPNICTPLYQLFQMFQLSVGIEKPL